MDKSVHRLIDTKIKIERLANDPSEEDHAGYYKKCNLRIARKFGNVRPAHHCAG